MKKEKKSWHINVKRDVEKAGEDKEGCQVDFFFLYFIEQCQFRWSILEVCLLYTKKKKSEGEKDMMH